MRRYYQEIVNPDNLLIVPDGAQPVYKPVRPEMSKFGEIPAIGISISGLFPPYQTTPLLIHLENDCRELSEAEAIALYPTAATVSC